MLRERVPTLAITAIEVVAAEPDSFPITEHVRVDVASAQALPDGDGYSGIDAIEEVLADAGVLKDERQVSGESQRVDSSLGGFVVIVRAETED